MLKAKKIWNLVSVYIKKLKTHWYFILMIMSIIIKKERYILKLYKKKTDIVILIAGILSLECILYILILHAPKTNIFSNHTCTWEMHNMPKNKKMKRRFSCVPCPWEINYTGVFFFLFPKEKWSLEDGSISLPRNF